MDKLDFIFIAYVLVMIYASISDIKTRQVSDLVHISIIILSLSNISIENIFACLVGFILFLIPNFIKDESMGGADIKFMSVSGLFLGTERLIISVIISMTIVVIVDILKKIIFKKNEKSVALIPYLSIGCFFSAII